MLGKKSSRGEAFVYQVLLYVAVRRQMLRPYSFKQGLTVNELPVDTAQGFTVSVPVCGARHTAKRGV